MSQIFSTTQIFNVAQGDLIEYEAKRNSVKVIGIEYDPNAGVDGLEGLVDIKIYNVTEAQTPMAPGKTWVEGGALSYEGSGGVWPTAVQLFPIDDGDDFEIIIKVGGVVIYQREVASISIDDFGCVQINAHARENQEAE